MFDLPVESQRAGAAGVPRKFGNNRLYLGLHQFPPPAGIGNLEVFEDFYGSGVSRPSADDSDSSSPRDQPWDDNT